MKSSNPRKISIIPIKLAKEELTMSVFEKSGYWYVEVSLPNGKKLKRSVGEKGIVTKAVARQVEQDLKRKIKLAIRDDSS